MFGPASWQERRGGSGPLRLVRRLVVLVFAVIQLILVGRILLDLGVLPADGSLADAIVPLSDALAAPVQGVGSGLGGLLGGGAFGGFGAGTGGLNAVMVAALVGWTIVEALVLRVADKFAAV